MRERMDTGISGLYPSPAPAWHSTWQVAALFGINDSSLRRQVENKYFPGAEKDEDGHWVIPRLAIAKRLLALDEWDRLHGIDASTKLYSVYRWYDVDYVLLYVGFSKNAPRRTKQHEQDKEWWELTAHAEVEHFKGKDEALAYEAEAIRSENPIYNKMRYGG